MSKPKKKHVEPPPIVSEQVQPLPPQQTSVNHPNEDSGHPSVELTNEQVLDKNFVAQRRGSRIARGAIDTAATALVFPPAAPYVAGYHVASLASEEIQTAVVRAHDARDRVQEKVVDATKQAANKATEGTKDAVGKAVDGTKAAAAKVSESASHVVGKATDAAGGVAEGSIDAAGKVVENTKNIAGKLTEDTLESGKKVVGETKDAVGKIGGRAKRLGDSAAGFWKRKKQ